MSVGCFVTGTDTGVGKTVAACALVAALRARGLAAVGMKPVAAGCEAGPNGPVSEDAALLRDVSHGPPPLSLVNPIALPEPIAPHLAARQAGVTIEPGPILSALDRLRAMAQAVVVEGVGGFLVPLAPGFDAADLARLTGYPVVLVVGIRLGCLNHALLTAEAVRSRGLTLAGWIANHVDPAMPAAAENVDTLRASLACPMLGEFPWLPGATARELASRLDLGPLAGGSVLASPKGLC